MIPADPAVPRIEPLPAGIKRPLWSVMIPTYNCARYLRETLRSVLAQDLGPDEMQIEVIDDCSTLDDPAAVVEQEGGGRVSFYRNAQNEGASRNFNTCIERSEGEFVHILHGDDVVLSNYYRTITDLAKSLPEFGLYATRCFFVDEQSIIVGVGERIPALERGGKSVKQFYYHTPLLPAGITVRRSSYEALGGFRTDLLHAADCEMCARIVAAHGAVVSSDVLGLYRVFGENDSARLKKTGENIKDVRRLYDIFSERYPEFSMDVARQFLSDMAWRQYRKFQSLGDEAAACANRGLWLEYTPAHRKLVGRMRELIDRYRHWLVETAR